MTMTRYRMMLTLGCLAAATGGAYAQSSTGQATLAGTASPQTSVLEAKPQERTSIGQARLVGTASPQTTVLEAKPQVPAAAPQAAPREPIRIKGPVRIAPQGPQMESGVDSLDLDFSGAGADAMRQRARPAPVALRSAARALVADAAAADDCDTYPDGDRVFFADLDGDGQPEGLAIYTLEGCGGGGNNYTRSAAVLRDSPTQGWTKVTEFTMGTKLVGERTVTRIDRGALMLDGSAGPQTARIPPAGR